MELKLIGNLKNDLDELYYDNTSVDNLLVVKADKNHTHSSYYTKSEIDELLGD